MGWLLDSMTIGNVATGALLDTFAKAGLVLLAALGGAYLLRRASAATRYQLWTAALIGVLALPMLSALLPAWQVPLLPAEMLESGLAEAPSAAPLSPSTLPIRQGIGSNESALSPAGETVALPRSANAAAPARVSELRPGLLSGPPALLGSTTWTALISAIWVAGTLFLLARLALSTVAAWWVTRHAEPLRGSRWAVTARAVQDRLGITADVDLLTSDKNSMPMAWGIFRQRVLLPREAESWSNERRRVVLMHEMAHLKRHDCRTLLLARLVTALYWVNPLVWVANKQMHAERERACDDLVLNTGTRGTDYAQHLLEIARSMRRPTVAGYAAVAMARPSQLEGRLLRILDPNLNRRATRMASATGIVLVSLLVLPLAALQPWAEASVPEQEQAAGQQQAAAPQRPELDVQVDARVAPEKEQDRTVVNEAVIEADEIARWINGYFTEEHLQGWTENAVQGIDVEQLVARVIEAARQSGIRGELRNAFAGGQLDEQALREAFQEALESVDEEQIRVAIEVALARLENFDFEFAFEGFGEQREVDPRVLAALSKALGDTEWRIREQAAESLGNLEDPAAIGALSEVLAADSEPRVREQAAWALGMIEDAAAVPGLSAALQDENAKVREEAAWALGMIESDTSVAALSNVLDDESWRVRKEAAWALGMIEDASAVEALVNALRDENAKVREQAAWALGMIEDERALDALLDAMSDDNLEVRREALWAVSMISGNSA